MRDGSSCTPRGRSAKPCCAWRNVPKTPRSRYCHHALGTTWLYFGALPAAGLHLEEAIARSTPDQRRAPVFRIGQIWVLRCRANAALLLWLLGYPEQALARLHEALALAHELPHPFSLALARCWAAYVYQFRWDVPAVHEQAEAAVALSIEQGFPFWGAAGRSCVGGAGHTGPGRGGDGRGTPGDRRLPSHWGRSARPILARNEHSCHSRQSSVSPPFWLCH